MLPRIIWCRSVIRRIQAPNPPNRATQDQQHVLLQAHEHAGRHTSWPAGSPQHLQPVRFSSAQGRIEAIIPATEATDPRPQLQGA